MKLTVNLNANFLCPFQLLIDINAQLPKSSSQLNTLAFAPICELNAINDWINLESLGKPPALRAQTLTNLIVEQLQILDITVLECHITLDEGILGLDNLYALLFLAEHLTRLDLMFYTQAAQTEQLQQTLAVLQNKTNTTINYTDPTQPANPLIEQHRQQLLQKLGFVFGNQVTAALIPALIGYAWICLKAGAHHCGTIALAKALAQADLPPALRETVFMHLQLTRFLSHQYAAVAATDFPEQFHFLDPKDAVSLHFIKAYSATLTRNLPVAAQHFEQCQVNEHLVLSDENSLYRLNLFALFLALQGQADLAMSLEMRIKDYIAAHDINIVGLKYVNFINIARLYKKSQLFDQALAYYSLAYQEISGGFTASDRIYYNMNRGSVYEATGDFHTALNFWLQAVIHWLCFNNQYALSWRPRLILCQEKITDILAPLPLDKANLFLYEKIHSLIEHCNIQLAQTEIKLQFSVDNPHTSNLDCCYIADGLTVYASSSAHVLKPRCIQESQLIELISPLIKYKMAIQNGDYLLMVDPQQEFYPSSAQQAAALAYLSNCPTCYYHGEKLSEPPKLGDKCSFSLSAAIRSINSTEQGLTISYGRSFLNQTITEAKEVDLINRLRSEEQITLNQVDGQAHKALMQLINKQVVVVVYEEMPAYRRLSAVSVV